MSADSSMRPGDGSLFAPADTGGEDFLLRLIDLDSPLNFVPLNVADNRLHLGLGLGMLAAGLTHRQDESPARRRHQQSSLLSGRGEIWFRRLLGVR